MVKRSFPHLKLEIFREAEINGRVIYSSLLDLLVLVFPFNVSFSSGLIYPIFEFVPRHRDTEFSTIYLMRITEKRDQRRTRLTKPNDFVRSLNNNVHEIFGHFFILLKNFLMSDEELYESIVRCNCLSFNCIKKILNIILTCKTWNT